MRNPEVPHLPEMLAQVLAREKIIRAIEKIPLGTLLINVAAQVTRK